MNNTIQEQYERDYSWFSKEHIEEESKSIIIKSENI